MLEWPSSTRKWFVDRLLKQKEYEQDEMDKSSKGR